MSIDPENCADFVKKKHDLISLHIFDQGEKWRVFGFRMVPEKSYKASVAQGVGASINEALLDLDDSLTIGPIAANLKKRAPK